MAAIALQLCAAPCFEDQLHPACNRSTVSTGRGASHSTTCIPGGSTRGHRGDVLQTSRQWLRQDATEFRTQTNVHGAQRSARPSADKCSTFRINGRSADELRLAQVRMPTGAGAKMTLQVHLPRDGPAHGRVGHPILRCVRQTPRVRWIAHRACSLGGRHISKRLRDSKQKARFGQRDDSRFRVPSHERGCRRRQGTDCAQLVVRGVVDAGSCPLN